MISQKRKLRHREVKELVQAHRVAYLLGFEPRQSRRLSGVQALLRVLSRIANCKVWGPERMSVGLGT